MRSKRVIRLIVVSDLHASAKAGQSHFHTPSVKPLVAEPAKAMLELISKERIAADYVICCGDLANKADKVGLEAAWSFLQKIKAEVGAQDVITTVGNHDVDSKFQGNGYSPIDHLKSLKPRFPLAKKSYFQGFWSEDFVVIKRGQVRFLIINTAALHGYQTEHEHGRVSKRMLDGIRKEIAAAGEYLANICILHHHPHRHAEIEEKDYDDIHGGQQLMDLLGTASLAPWLVVHGHKHHPRVTYGQGCSRSPIVFSAGSFSALLHEGLHHVAKNQFYLIEISPEHIHRCGTLVGRFSSWAWYQNDGWLQSKKAAGLPRRGGFGFRDLISLSRRLSSVPKRRIYKWEAIQKKFPEVAYLTPADWIHLVTLLQKQKVSIVVDDTDEPIQLIRS